MKSRLLTPEALDNLKNLTLCARRVVEGFMAGLHRSPYHGFSLEFAEYRAYMPGDDLRYFDWKALGKSDRGYIKKFQSETNTRVDILLDCSASMGYTSGASTTLRFGAALAAAFVHLAIRQGDAVGITTFSDGILERLPPGRGPRHRHLAMELLEQARPGRTTGLAKTLHNAADAIRHRSMVILISDLFDDPESVLDGIYHLDFKRHEVLVFQVLDPAERTFPFSGLCEFQDLETGARIQVVPEEVGEVVRSEVDRFIAGLKDALTRRSIDHQEMTTDEAFDTALARYLHHRMRSGSWSS